jgi:Pyruvate/2-oxoglutarate dehydrogenase complex, dehydrogenase (E1) component, eukaryotic type, beta subunit
MRKMKYAAAICEALDEEMARDKNVLMLGEDVGFIGGNFKCSEGLLEKYGDLRMKDTPISEQGFLGMVDREITDKVTKQLEGMGIVIHTSAKVTAITDKAVVFEKDGKEQSVETKKVLMSVGRGPRLDGIDTEKLGLEMNRGAIVTDEHLRTNIPHGVLPERETCRLQSGKNPADK